MMVKKISFVLILFLLDWACLTSAKTYLVSVGISDYPGTQNDLKLPVSDAKTIAWLYSENSNAEYKLLTNSQATVNNILAAIKSTFASAKPNDIVVFFFSGHGCPGCFVAYDKMLTYSMVREAMSKNSSKNKMIFADACFSGKIRTSQSESSSQVAEAKKSNVMLFLSSRGDETSIERGFMQNGYFTSYLQKGLRGGADANKDRIITAKEIYNYVHKKVIKISKDAQHPVMWGNFSDNMPVMKW